MAALTATRPNSRHKRPNNKRHKQQETRFTHSNVTHAIKRCTTHLLGSTEHPPFARSRTTQQPATAVHSPVSVHNTSSMGNAVRVCRQGTEAKTHQPELQADGPPSSTSTFHTHASSETALHTRCSSGTLLTRSLQMAQLIVSSSSTWLGHTRSENVYRGPF